MSIYISIPTLVDPELINTVSSAINNANNPKNIFIGIAFTTTEEYYKKVCKQIYHPNIRTGLFDIKNNAGVGKGRNSAASFYNGEDYFLQVDAHTFFQPSWDDILVEIYNKALEKTNNDKTILTAIPPKYKVSGGIRIITTREARYPLFKNEYFFGTDILRWTEEPIKVFPLEYRTKEPVIPCIKFNAAFAFGNKHFVESNSLPIDTYFFEEEIFQTLNLLDAGFSLAFPNSEIPINHLFWDDQDLDNRIYRQEAINIFPDIDEKEFSQIMSNHYYNFLNNPQNKQKCERFERYTRYNLYTKEHIKFYIPKEHNR